MSKIDLFQINLLLKDEGICVTGETQNTKSSDYFVKVTFIFNDEKWNAVVPYIYRRSGLNLGSDEEIARYLVSIKPYFQRENRDVWRKKEWKIWEDMVEKVKNPDALVTVHFFETLLSFREEVDSFPENPNAQRRFQDLKDRGYTISIYPIGNHKWGKMLLPIPVNEQMGYETFTPQFKARVIRLLQGRNAYEAKETASKSLIPDHKFSEIRWDENTKGENPMTMTDEEIISKFQLLDNQRNQQKREVCRKCFQEGIRGMIYGIDYYYKGSRNWDKNLPQRGKQAEEGCIGCPWYDIEEWRRSLNNKIKDKE